MWRAVLAGLVSCAAACNTASGGAAGAPSADDTPPPVAAAGEPDCATPREVGWPGVVRIERADVVWTFAETRGCIDTYIPSGTAHHPGGVGCARRVRPASAPISADDGSLVVDRSSNPPTYRVTGKTRWNADDRCGVPRIVCVEWGDHHGVIAAR